MERDGKHTEWFKNYFSVKSSSELSFLVQRWMKAKMVFLKMTLALKCPEEVQRKDMHKATTKPRNPHW